MRINKDSFKLQTLIPIEKKIKISQMHLDTITNRHMEPPQISIRTKKLKVNSIMNSNLILPTFSSPKSQKSTSRINHAKGSKFSMSSNPHDQVDQQYTLDQHYQMYSPAIYKKIIEKDINRIIRNVDKTNDKLNSPLLLESKRLLSRIKKNMSLLHHSNYLS